MFLNEIFESDNIKLVVTYPGRFQPFGLNHRAVYEHLISTFGRDNVYVVTSGKVKEDSPFDFGDRVQFMTAQGVSQDRILQSDRPFTFPKEFKDHVNNVVFITAVGEPDKDRLNPDTVYQQYRKDGRKNTSIPKGKQVGDPTYYKTWRGLKESVTADKHGFVYVVPEFPAEITINKETIDVTHGTQVRELWNNIRSKDKLRKEFLGQIFGHADPTTGKLVYNPELGNILDKIPVDDAKPVKSTRAPKLPKPVVAAGLRENREKSKDDVVDPKSSAILKKAHIAHPLAQSDEEALALYSLDVEERDVQRLGSENEREDREIERLSRLERKLERGVDSLQRQLDLISAELLTARH
jgi:hypothetical protein